jgi:hypothetical protein
VAKFVFSSDAICDFTFQTGVGDQELVGELDPARFQFGN